MFTGIITGVGHITRIEDLGNTNAHGKRLHISTPPGYLDDVGLGDSIALNGACMTVTSFDATADLFTIDISVESLSKTSGLDATGTINLEKALRAHDRLGGHIVSGHVDGIGQVRRFDIVGESWLLQIQIPQALAKFLAHKGSITVNGVSLTVNNVLDNQDGCIIDINLIPHTIANTALGELKASVQVNLEIDLIARYCERMLSKAPAPAA
ncbi:riboflavin synthase [Comamonadaceae bacterium M7527]|nr:riboflavin synthase [Comamonadaceae bacterium M7527]